MLLSFFWVILFGFFYINSKRNAELRNLRSDGFWYGWNAAFLLSACFGLLSKILIATGH